MKKWSQSKRLRKKATYEDSVGSVLCCAVVIMAGDLLVARSAMWLHDLMINTRYAAFRLSVRRSSQIEVSKPDALLGFGFFRCYPIRKTRFFQIYLIDSNRIDSMAIYQCLWQMRERFSGMCEYVCVCALICATCSDAIVRT